MILAFFNVHEVTNYQNELKRIFFIQLICRKFIVEKKKKYEGASIRMSKMQFLNKAEKSDKKVLMNSWEFKNIKIKNGRTPTFIIL